MENEIKKKLRNDGDYHCRLLLMSTIIKEYADINSQKRFLVNTMSGVYKI
jgi:hypothetical protein